MGRDAGWLTAASHLANINGDVVQLIYLPEVAFNMDEFLKDVEKIYKEKKKVLVAISEGIRDKDGKYILEYQGTTESDKFGHMQLGGVGQVLAGIVNQKLGISTRAIELSLPQRCAAHLGSLTDVKEAEKAGSWAVKYAVNRKSGMMVSYKRVSDYKIVYKTAKLIDVANQVKEFPKEWIINGNSISNDYLTYALPLIKGESYPKYNNGLPNYSKLK
jgi:6-phosphofructokinase 1